MDWSKLENIIFVAVTAVLAVTLLVAAFVIMSKGKRKTCALDILLRIVSIITLAASFVMFVAALFADFEGDYRIAITSGEQTAATLVLGAKTVELPFPQLFAALATTTGHELVVCLLVISLIVLVLDFMTAKRKYGAATKSARKKSDKSVAKTPEDAKRAAELEKIKRLGDAAVKKTNAAASSKTSETTQAPAQPPAPEKQAQADEEPDWLKHPTAADWRAEVISGSSEFVGLSGLDDNDRDFDTFDDPDGEREDRPWYEQTDETPEPSTVTTDDNADAELDINDEAPGAENPFEPDALDEDVSEAAQDETEAFDEFDERETETDDGDFDAFEDEAEAYEDAETNETDESGEAYDTVDSLDPEDFYDAPTDEARDDYGSDEAENGAEDREASYGVEPDRDIYIPKMRTIARDMARPAARRTGERATAGRKPAATGTADTATEKKLSAKNRATARPSSNGKPKSTKGAKKPHDPKSLPVTRRYVILDRTSAVNIFSDYLKERDKADMDKLESSISTIIIK